MGYDAIGRTLSINEAEAATVRELYTLYEAHKTVRAVKEQADRLKLTSKRRLVSDGTVRGGGSFARGHIHRILTNPIFAGRIRHRKAVHEGQHPALIDPERWDRKQKLLQDSATKDRRTSSKSQSSLLCGKLFDETGVRLMPSHTKARSGKRLRHYISHRFISKSGEMNLDGWRLPARNWRLKLRL